MILISLVIYTFLSWILLFRQEQTLEVIGKFYPQLSAILWEIRTAFLHLGLNSLVTVIFGIIICLAFWAYWRLTQLKIPLKRAILLVILAQIIVFFSYPVLSTDIFDYILTNRVAVVYQKNIWVVPPAAFPKDPFYSLANWKRPVTPIILF
ncbi:hypothetical protein HY085_00660 [Candidatus Gottesmanbacteria bacterium]|nr:hypothetical protein [Candidatus Gottesmanbacteria bacterium]